MDSHKIRLPSLSDETFAKVVKEYTTSPECCVARLILSNLHMTPEPLSPIGVHLRQLFPGHEAFIQCIEYGRNYIPYSEQETYLQLTDDELAPQIFQTAVLLYKIGLPPKLERQTKFIGPLPPTSEWQTDILLSLCSVN